MQKICGVSLYCPRGQCVLILLAACKELGGSPSKNECLEFVTARRWFNKDLGQDLRPYPGNASNEPRWKTLFSWARNDAADHGCIIRGDDGFWPISTQGKEELAQKIAFLRSHDMALRLLFLATLAFKRHFVSGYELSKDDIPRPASIYEDSGAYLPHNIHRLILDLI